MKHLLLFLILISTSNVFAETIFCRFIADDETISKSLDIQKEVDTHVTFEKMQFKKYKDLFLELTYSKKVKDPIRSYSIKVGDGEVSDRYLSNITLLDGIDSIKTSVTLSDLKLRPEFFINCQNKVFQE